VEVTRGAPASAASTDGTFDIIPLEDVEMTGSRAPCPRCGAAMVAGISACGSCGYDPSSVPLNTEKAREVLGDFDNDGTFTPSDERARMKAAAKVKKANLKEKPSEIPCKKCSQNLLGVPVRKDGVIVCPECGVENRPITRREYDEEVSASVHRWTYLRPALMLGIGLAVCVVLWAANGWIRGGMVGAASGWIGNGPPGGVVGSVVQVGVGFVGFTIASIAAVGAVIFAGWVWTGFAGSMPLIVLQTTGCLATSLAMVLFMRAIPIPFPGMIIIALGAMLYAYLLSEEIDVYLQDATIITVMTFAAIVFISFTGLLL
jgi:DNA-directed RNA polymerase subunit M/transcription elongation factor TFIIS